MNSIQKDKRDETVACNYTVLYINVNLTQKSDAN